MNVEVVYATLQQQTVIALVLEPGATVADAIDASGLYQRYPSIEPQVTPVGIYAERVHYDTVLRDGDRVEIYRPLEVDPMQARRLRAEAQKGTSSNKIAQAKNRTR